MPDQSNSFVGKSINRIDSKAKVTGEALYPGDFNRPDQLYMKTIFAETPHAIVKNVDIAAALEIKGVISIITAEDVPNNEYGLMTHDQPVLCGPGSTNIHADKVRFIGDQIALIIAETEEIAEAASKKIKITFDHLPVISDIDQAMDSGAYLIHPDLGSNEFCSYKVRHGDIEAGFQQADIIIESEYNTPMQEHAYLQPEAGISYVDETGRITVVVAGQWAHEDREQIAHALNLSEEKIRVIYPAIGGAFGGREDMSVQITLALASLKLQKMGINRPVKTVWDRRESIIGHHKRHHYRIRTKWGVRKDGKITAVQAEIVADGGAYMYTSNKVLGNATLMITGPYFVPHVKVDSKAIVTNNIPGGAFRGFGAPQACFAAEMQMNKLAQALSMDPVEIRMRNIIQEGQDTLTGSPLPEGISIGKVIEACAISAGWEKTGQGWKQKRMLSRKNFGGIGFAAGYKNIGFSFGAPESCWAQIKLIGSDQIEKVILAHAGADVGQGAHTIFIQIAAQILGVQYEIIELVASDTAASDSSGSASASRMTFMAGNAIIGAAQEAIRKWRNEERPTEATFIYRAPETSPFDPETGKCNPNFAYGYVAEAVEVEVDPETGKVDILKVHCADDVGKAINPLQVIGQVEGAIVQAAGYSTIENFIQKNGLVKTDSLATYLVPTIMDIPREIKAIILEEPEPNGPIGARGMGEMPYIPFAPALISAVHKATGIWHDSFPLTEERVLERLGKL